MDLPSRIATPPSMEGELCDLHWPLTEHGSKYDALQKHLGTEKERSLKKLPAHLAPISTSGCALHRYNKIFPGLPILGSFLTASPLFVSVASITYFPWRLT